MTHDWVRVVGGRLDGRIARVVAEIHHYTYFDGRLWGELELLFPNGGVERITLGADATAVVPVDPENPT